MQIYTYPAGKCVIDINLHCTVTGGVSLTMDRYSDLSEINMGSDIPATGQADIKLMWYRFGSFTFSTATGSSENVTVDFILNKTRL